MLAFVAAIHGLDSVTISFVCSVENNGSRVRVYSVVLSLTIDVELAVLAVLRMTYASRTAFRSFRTLFARRLGGCVAIRSAARD